MLGLRLLKGAALGRLPRGHFWSRRAYELAYASQRFSPEIVEGHYLI
jgi:hypothetical protein